METLLSLAFDNLSSYDGGKVRKGLRQVDGLLAQICLSRGATRLSTAEKRRSAIPTSSSSAAAATKPLGALREDPAFREFFKLQDGFEWNVTQRLIICLDRLLGRGSNGQNDLLILSTLDLIQGLLLLHPPSRALFAREQCMNLLLDLLEPSNCPAVQCASLITLLCALLDQPTNTRSFETLDGLLTITSLFKQRSIGREVKLKLVEFLAFYLMPEIPSSSASSSSAATTTTAPTTPTGIRRGPSQVGQSIEPGRNTTIISTTNQSMIRSAEEKQALLGKYLPNVHILVEDLKDRSPFGAVYPPTTSC